MRLALRLVVPVVLALALLPGTAGATHLPDQSSNMAELFESGNQATNSDLAFWGKHAFVGYYTGDTGFPAGTGSRGGVRIFDISNPASPRLVRDFACDANQNRSEEHTSELQSQSNLVCRLLLEKKKNNT